MKEKNKREKDASVRTNPHTIYVRAQILRGKEKELLLVDDFLERNSIKIIYSRTSLAPLYISTKKEDS